MNLCFLFFFVLRLLIGIYGELKWNLSVIVCYLLHIVIDIQTHTYIHYIQIRKHIQPYTKLII